ncbi:unnamed protein product [Bursaphelenchus okinawaensis]|uniref:Uncharacterized protein n=1 Tax=Bursaphelenchus okinawaensis TaxID=465554 RepID=A0A811L4D0_9BILA|nr:unnamed protein product [Bursaphelenchus okinawaensis]CAG9119363.1 unnamed protein product [Bursaphelenchus okinawaensis]
MDDEQPGPSNRLPVIQIEPSDQPGPSNQQEPPNQQELEDQPDHQQGGAMRRGHQSRRSARQAPYDRPERGERDRQDDDEVRLRVPEIELRPFNFPGRGPPEELLAELVNQLVAAERSRSPSLDRFDGRVESPERDVQPIPDEMMEVVLPEVPTYDYQAVCRNCSIFRLPNETWETAYSYTNHRIFSARLFNDEEKYKVSFGANVTLFCFIYDTSVVVLDLDFYNVDRAENYTCLRLQPRNSDETVQEVRIFDNGKKLAMQTKTPDGQHFSVFSLDLAFRSTNRRLKDMFIYKTILHPGFTERIQNMGYVVDCLNNIGVYGGARLYRSGGDDDSNKYMWSSTAIRKEDQASREEIRVYDLTNPREPYVIFNRKYNILPQAEIKILSRTRTVWINEIRYYKGKPMERNVAHRVPRAYRLGENTIIRPQFNELFDECTIHADTCTCRWKPLTDYILQNHDGEICAYNDTNDTWEDVSYAQILGHKVGKEVNRLMSHSLGDKHAIVSEETCDTNVIKKTLFMLEIKEGLPYPIDIGDCTKLSMENNLFSELNDRILAGFENYTGGTDMNLHLHRIVKECVHDYIRGFEEQHRAEPYY